VIFSHIMYPCCAICRRDLRSYAKKSQFGALMIVAFSVSNFRSFLDEETFSLVASKRISGTHEDHTTPIPGTAEKVLRTGVIYGANGAGKSNLFKALEFVRGVALRARKKNSGTGREAFRFSGTSEQPSAFDLQFIVGEKLYQFGFKATDQQIAEEWLLQLEGNREKVIYERTTTTEGNVTIDLKGARDAGEKLRALATVGGPQNQSFLATVGITLEASDYGKELSAIIEWFNDLKLISPESSAAALGQWLETDPDFNKFAGEFLKSSSTGVDHLNVIKTEIPESEARSLIPEHILSTVLQRMTKEGVTMASLEGGTGEFLVERTDKDHYHKISIEAAHEHIPGQSVSLDLSEESDGTQRLLNLAPALYHLRTDPGVYFIDEIDRSLHPILIWKFLEYFLKSCTNGQQQVVVTTHESNLLDLNLLRRDEIWFVEKDDRGATRLYSLSDFKIRKDLEIRKHYLQGRFGAVPFLSGLDRLLEEQSQEHESRPTEA
jgi:uncharacterized protein